MFSKCDAVLLLHTEQDTGHGLKYLSDYEGDYAYGVFFKRKKAKIFVSSLESLPKSSTIDYEHLTRKGQVKDFLLAKKVKTLGLAYNEISKQTYDLLRKNFRSIQFVDISEELQQQRIIKRPEEVKYLQRAIQITEKLLAEVIEQLKTAQYEKEVEIYLRQRMIELDVKPSFDPIIATGYHSKFPHYQATKKSLVLEGFCIIDMGVQYKGYCADLSRTIYIGTPTDEEKKLYQKVEQELRIIEKHVHAGVKEIETSFPMVHALGHGIGKEVHERPYLGHEVLKSGMCIAIEPAQYFTKGGIRIEDNYLVTTKGLQRLSKSSRKLHCITREL